MKMLDSLRMELCRGLGFDPTKGYGYLPPAQEPTSFYGQGTNGVPQPQTSWQRLLGGKVAAGVAAQEEGLCVPRIDYQDIADLADNLPWYTSDDSVHNESRVVPITQGLLKIALNFVHSKEPVFIEMGHGFNLDTLTTANQLPFKRIVGVDVHYVLDAIEGARGIPDKFDVLKSGKLELHQAGVPLDFLGDVVVWVHPSPRIVREDPGYMVQYVKPGGQLIIATDSKHVFESFNPDPEEWRLLARWPRLEFKAPFFSSEYAARHGQDVMWWYRLPIGSTVEK